MSVGHRGRETEVGFGGLKSALSMQLILQSESVTPNRIEDSAKGGITFKPG